MPSLSLGGKRVRVRGRFREERESAFPFSFPGRRKSSRSSAGTGACAPRPPSITVRLMDSRLLKLQQLNRSLKFPDELGGVFLPSSAPEKFEIIFVGEMPSMNEPLQISPGKNYNIDVTTRDKFFPRRPSRQEIRQWLPFLLEEIAAIRPKGIIVLGKRTYEASFKPYVRQLVSKDILIDWVFHYSSQVQRSKFERRFGDTVERMKRRIEESERT